jgi:hypothetical protein
VRRPIPITIACVLAIAATVAGWSQSLIYRVVPQVPLAIWFPTIPLTGAGGLEMVGLSLIQFPLFAVAFAIGIRRWSMARVVVALVLIYGLMVSIALSIVTSR